MKPVIGVLSLMIIAGTCWQQSGRGRGSEPDLPILERVPAPEDLGGKAYKHVAQLVSFGERWTGSPGWQEALEYIAIELQKYGLEPKRDRWLDKEEEMTFENISALIPGESNERIVIGAHFDTKKTSGHADEDHNYPFVGANDSGSGVGLLLALAETLAKQRSKASFEVVFFDGEESIPYEWDDFRSLFGSRHYVSKYVAGRKAGTEKSPIRAFILLDMVGAKDLDIDDDSNSDDQLHRIFAAAAIACGHEKYFFEHPQTVKDDHLPFIDAKIPAIDLIDIADNPQWHTEDDTLEHISAESLQIVGEVVITALPAVEKDFLVGDSGLAIPPRRR
ncbi:MAG: M28 family metallopeptidase [Planctomycetota bacterium]